MTSTPDAPLLPAHIDEALLVPDPSNRAGVWYFEPNDDVIAMPPDWQPKSGPFAKSVLVPFDAAPYTMLTQADLSKMNKGQMTVVAQALGVSGIDKVSKPDGIASILTAIEALRAVSPANDEAEAAADEADDADDASDEATETEVSGTTETETETKEATDATDDLTGKSVIVLSGPLSGKIGVVSEVGVEGDNFAVRVLVEGKEHDFAAFEPEMRFATEEESAAAAASR